MTRPGAAQQGAGAGDPAQLGQDVHGRVDHLLDRGSVSALSESVSKSALTLPVMSNAALLRASSASASAARAAMPRSEHRAGPGVAADPDPPAR